MIKPTLIIAICMTFFVGHSQEPSLPADLRQHALTQYNASLFNPTFSLDRNNPESVAFWTRWQWQNVDADPTTLFLNYSRRLNENSAAGAGFFQHNTGIYFNTGAALNYAYQIEFNRLIKLSFGANLFGFQQQIADTRFPVNSIPGLPQSTPTDDFILQMAPGFNLSVENFSMSLASENLFDYNFTDKAANTATADKIFMGMASYDFPVMASDSTAYLQPSIYLRTIPEQENQIGINTLLSTQKYWAQVGYNNFYGISVGGGGTVLNRFSLGALLEFGTSASLNSKNPSFEIVAAYFLGKPENRRKEVVSGIEEIDQEVLLLNQDLTIEQMREELKKAEAAANGVTVSEEKTDTVVDDTQNVASEVKGVEGVEVEVDKTTDKKELKRLANEQKALEKQKKKDALAAKKKEKEALAVQEKMDAEKAKIAKSEAKEAEKEADLVAEEKRKEQQRLAALKNSEDVKVAAEATAKEEEAKQAEQDRQAVIKRAAELATTKKAAEVAAAQKAAELVTTQKVAEAAAAQKVAEVAAAQKAAEVAAAQKAAEDAKSAKEDVVASTETIKPEAGEKYEEVTNEDGLKPGFYLIANVFSTKKYFDAFMNDLTKKGMQPKSFFRSKNKYNYSYLEKYETIGEARRARDTNFGGKYSGKTWIFRVVK